MARLGFALTKIGTLIDGTGVGGVRAEFQPAGNDGGTALATAMAVLVTDGASPTQAHVTTANAALSAVQGDVSITFDNAKITTINQLKRAFEKALQIARGSGIAEG